jgi:hypothetical protein
MSLDPRAQVEEFAAAFRGAGCPERARGQQAYMKTELAFHGVNTPFLRATAKTFFRAHRHLDREDLIAIVEEQRQELVRRRGEAARGS